MASALSRRDLGIDEVRILICPLVQGSYFNYYFLVVLQQPQQENSCQVRHVQIVRNSPCPQLLVNRPETQKIRENNISTSIGGKLRDGDLKWLTQDQTVRPAAKVRIKAKPTESLSSALTTQLTFSPFFQRTESMLRLINKVIPEEKCLHMYLTDNVDNGIMMFTDLSLTYTSLKQRSEASLSFRYSANFRGRI